MSPRTTDSPATRSPVFREMQEKVHTAMRDNVMRLCPGVSHVVGYHAGWLDTSGELVHQPSGKGLRSRLAVLSGLAVNAAPDVCAAAAMAVEFVHDFSILQDDVMDGDVERRHRPAAWTVFGSPAAVLAGDSLLAASVEVLLAANQPRSVSAVRRLLAAVRSLVFGQTEDLGFERRAVVTVGEYMEMARRKTASLLACASSIGAELGGAPPAVVDGLEAFGSHLGLAFQLTDDLLGIWGEPAITGKPALEDLRRRKKSAPVVAALCAGGDEVQELEALYSSLSPLTDAEVARAALLVERCGGRAWTEQRASEHVEEALRSLGGLDLRDGVVDELEGVARSLTHRRA